MYKEYIELYKTYTQKYGPKTAIFLMVGSFYELYDIQCAETGETVCNVREIVDYLGIQLTTKKGDVSFADFKSAEGLFAGFPDYVMHKWAGRLTSAGFNVVVVDQIKDMKGKVKERKVARILSPSTHIENTSSVDTPYVMTLFFDYNSNSDSFRGAPLFGTALLDLTTGSTRTYTGKATGHRDMWTADDIVQLWSIYQPKELIVYQYSSKNDRTIAVDESFFRRLLGFTASTPCYINNIDSIGSFSLPLVCQEYLQKVYSPKTVLPIKTYLGLRSDQEQTALLYLLQFVEEHYPSMLKSFQRNEPWIPNTQLICGNHALTQLQITSQSDNKQESVLGLFDKCITMMGKRAIKERILRPFAHGSEIDRRLIEVTACTEWPQDMTARLLQHLRFLYDIPRLHRKIQCGIIPSKEIFMLFHSYTAANHIMTLLKDTVLQSPFSYQDLQQYLTVFHTHFTENKCTEGDVTVFNVETYKDIGVKEAEIAVILHDYEKLRREYITNLSEDAVRLEERDKEYGFKCSTVTLQYLKKNIQQLPKNTKFTELKSGGWIDCTALQQLNQQIIKLREKLQQLTQIHMIDACQEISEQGQKVWIVLEDWLSHVDVTQCIARVSMERGYTRPVILEEEEEEEEKEGQKKGAEFSIKQIRHPLVEVSKTRVEYVQHDVSLNQETKGWLVYGMNASGKSTLMKATGICILLAQAGCFVPAKEMHLRPFKAIYTRIINQDNLFAGLSSFAIEMSELRDILRNADENTLVLGDELCSGTESTSAQALVASGIKWLTSKAAKFIFATHLHQLPELITSSDVTVLHLHVDYDPVTKKLIYDRTLRPGNGSTLYGLEVARAMDLPMEFIEQALEFRHKIIGSTTNEMAKSSAWNKEIVRRECDVCKLQITSELEVHHVSPRAAAVNKITHSGMHMNDARNLVVVCQTCHDAIHANKIEVGAVKMTSDGPERVIQKEPGASINNKINNKTNKSKWTEEEMQIMTDTVKKYASSSLKAIKGVLYSKYEIEVGEAILSKIRKGGS